MKANKWNVYLYGKLIDVVFCDADRDSWHVLHGLINHDGYHPSITVKLVRD